MIALPLFFKLPYNPMSADMQKNSKPEPLTLEQKRAQAERALAEAQQRREQAEMQTGKQKLAPEKNGRNGPEATRFGDWEKNGLTSDF